MNDILKAREERSIHIQELMDKHEGKSIVVLKANVPGENKNLMKMRFICQFYDHLIQEEFQQYIEESNSVCSSDGKYYFYIINQQGNLVKEKTVLLEDDNPLGRLIDIDVYYYKPITREEISCEMRKCLVCDGYAHVCTRQQKHTKEEVFSVINAMINVELQDLLFNITQKSIFAEIDLYPKFGLVSRLDNGSHDDMTYETFVISALSLKQYIKDVIAFGIKGDTNYQYLQTLGKKAELQMFKETGGVNTHKGLIFALGIFLPALAKGILYRYSIDELKEEINHISSVIIKDHFTNITTPNTHGEEMYLTYGVKGIRGEALKGFEIVLDSPSFKKADSIEKDYDYLLYLMSKLDDTTILYRKGMDTLKRVQEETKQLLEQGGYELNKRKYNILSETYKNENISPGGSADLLVIKFILEELRYLLNDEMKHKC